MKKYLALALTLVLALSLAACGGAAGDRTDSRTPNDGIAENNGGGDSFAYGNAKDYIAENLKGDYEITYRYYAGVGGGDASEVTLIKTAEGVYVNSDGSESLFVKNSTGNYDMYNGSAEEGFTKVDMGGFMTFDQAYVDALTVMTSGFMTQYGNYSSEMKKDGKETVAGRSCDKYTFSAAAFGTAVRYSCCIDRATGVCLKYTYDASVGGQSGGMAFECTQFKTSGVKLPKYN
ncbi:MAG: hypothetical protein FWF60_01475 [Oscillospiraceae bacterium]|nr:hypothetical protein [Oscillospiraceae bacterium]